MGQNSNIQWTDHTFCPWWGCSRVSPGCENCYAETFSNRLGGSPWAKGRHWGSVAGGAVRTKAGPKAWAQPVKWNAAAEKAGVRARVFCASMADWLDDAVPVEWLADLLALIAATPHLDWMLLTKRPELWSRRIGDVYRLRSHGLPQAVAGAWLAGSEPPNVWIGTTVEDQRRADERIPRLLTIPACVRFLSCEPLLEAVNLDLRERWGGGCKGGCLGSDLHLRNDSAEGCSRCGYPLGGSPRPPVGWVIVGGESGSKARPFHVAWGRNIVRQCRAAGVPVFWKQMGARVLADAGEFNDGHGQHLWPDLTVSDVAIEHNATVRVRLKDSHGGDWHEWPADLRVRQFPEVR